MNTFIPLRRVVLLLSGMVLLGLCACCSRTPAPTVETTYKITITYIAATGKLDYAVDKPGKKPKKLGVKRGDTVQWTCPDGEWKIYFKDRTPLVDPQTGAELPSVSGAAYATAGGEVSDKMKKGEEFEYGVSVVLTATGKKIEEDPRIFIEH